MRDASTRTETRIRRRAPSPRRRLPSATSSAIARSGAGQFEVEAKDNQGELKVLGAFKATLLKKSDAFVETGVITQERFAMRADARVEAKERALKPI